MVEDNDSSSLSDDDYVFKILIVDDQSFNIEAIKIILKYKVGIDANSLCDFALNGKHALDMIYKNVEQNNFKMCNYNLILLDCNMPFMDGYESSFRIRSYLYKHDIVQPIITAVTGQSD